MGESDPRLSSLLVRGDKGFGIRVIHTVAAVWVEQQLMATVRGVHAAASAPGLSDKSRLLRKDDLGLLLPGRQGFGRPRALLDFPLHLFDALDADVQAGPDIVDGHARLLGREDVRPAENGS